MDTKTQAIVDELANQRSTALNAVAMLAGEVAERDEKIARLEKSWGDIEALKARVVELTPTEARASQ